MTPHDLRDPGLERPFVNVRSTRPAETPLELAEDYAAKMRQGAYFSHVTAALLWGMWLPPVLQRRMLLDVGVPPHLRAPRDRRMKGHHLIERPGLVTTRRGVRVASPWETWCQLATVLGIIDLVVAGESLLAKNRPDRLRLGSLADAVAVGGRPRQRLLERALPLLREGSRSARETELRLLLVAAGIPEPEMNGNIEDGQGRWIGEFDLIWRAQRLVVEYDGEDHFLRPEIGRRDLARTRELEANGWKVVRVMKDDLVRPERIVELIRQARAARS